jgi:hypothetical protein
MGYSEDLRKLIYEKGLKLNIPCLTPFNRDAFYQLQYLPATCYTSMFIIKHFFLANFCTCSITCKLFSANLTYGYTLQTIGGFEE